MHSWLYPSRVWLFEWLSVSIVVCCHVLLYLCRQPIMVVLSHATTIVCPHSCGKERLRFAWVRSDGYICHLATSYVIINRPYESTCCNYLCSVGMYPLRRCSHSTLHRLDDNFPMQYLRKFREQAFTASCVLCNTKVFVQHKTSPLPAGAEASSSKVGAAGQKYAGRTYLKQ